MILASINNCASTPLLMKFAKAMAILMIIILLMTFVLTIKMLINDYHILNDVLNGDNNSNQRLSYS